MHLRWMGAALVVCVCWITGLGVLFMSRPKGGLCKLITLQGLGKGAAARSAVAGRHRPPVVVAGVEWPAAGLAEGKHAPRRGAPRARSHGARRGRGRPT